MRLSLIRFREHVRLPDGKYEEAIAMGNPHQCRAYALTWDGGIAYIRSKVDGWAVGVPAANVVYFVLEAATEGRRVEAEESKRK
jgi:hypothetical protein